MTFCSVCGAIIGDFPQHQQFHRHIAYLLRLVVAPHATDAEWNEYLVEAAALVTLQDAEKEILKSMGQTPVQDPD